MFADILFNGLVAGGTYAILAIGFALIFSVARIINMAHTAFYMIAAFLIYISLTILHYNLWPCMIATVVLTGIIGVICFKLFFDRVKQHSHAVMIISIAIALLLQEIFLIIFGGTYRSIPSFVEGYMEISGTRVSNQQLFAVLSTAVILVALWLWLSKTKIGNAIRSVAQDPEAANLMGINVSNIYLIVMAVSAGMAGIAGVLMAPVHMISPLMWGHPIIIVLASIVLGGMGSIGGSVVGALILGYVETLVVFLIPGGSFMGGAVSLAIMVLVLLIRPEGLFGIFFEEERL